MTAWLLVVIALAGQPPLPDDVNRLTNLTTHAACERRATEIRRDYQEVRTFCFPVNQRSYARAPHDRWVPR